MIKHECSFPLISRCQRVRDAGWARFVLLHYDGRQWLASTLTGNAMSCAWSNRSEGQSQCYREPYISRNMTWTRMIGDPCHLLLIALQAHFVQEMGRYLGLQNLLCKDIDFAGRVPCQIWNWFRHRIFLKIATRHEKRTSRRSRTSYRPAQTSCWVSSAGVVADTDSCSSHDVNLGR